MSRLIRSLINYRSWFYLWVVIYRLIFVPLVNETEDFVVKIEALKSCPW
uniref:Uncharacterized protein n=1 Tax=Manihot esculenta TaxID=3983 RepID=A0A2C9VGW8_MANES